MIAILFCVYTFCGCPGAIAIFTKFIYKYFVIYKINDTATQLKTSDIVT